jgi:hypothetical protein
VGRSWGPATAHWRVLSLIDRGGGVTGTGEAVRDDSWLLLSHPLGKSFVKFDMVCGHTVVSQPHDAGTELPLYCAVHCERMYCGPLRSGALQRPSSGLVANRSIYSNSVDSGVLYTVYMVLAQLT